jgi:hypothetical protein
VLTYVGVGDVLATSRRRRAAADVRLGEAKLLVALSFSDVGSMRRIDRSTTMLCFG